MPVLLFPAALAALAALAMPLAVHLARRSVLRPVDFAALRWLEARRRPRAQWRLDEWLLLLVRLLLVTLVALWLARPALEGVADRTPWTVVVPGAARPSGVTGEARWLAPGLPPLDRPAPAGPQPVGSLLREVDAALPPGAALTVVVPATIEGADAERPRLSRAVTWRVVRGAMPAATAVTAAQPPKLTVRYPPTYTAGVRFLRATAVAWALPGRAPAFDAAPVGTALPASPGVLVWLGDALSPAARDWVRRGGTAVMQGAAHPDDTVVWRDAVGSALVTSTPLGRGRILRLTRRLDPAGLPQLLDPDFPARFRALFDTPPPAPTRVAAADYIPTTGGATYPPPARDLQPWLALLIAAVFLAERALATGRRSAAA